VAKVEPLYRTLLEIECAAPDSKQGMAAAYSHLQHVLLQNRVTYDEFVWSL
jgi:hypothetical protein